MRLTYIPYSACEQFGRWKKLITSASQNLKAQLLNFIRKRQQEKKDSVPNMSPFE